MVVAESETAGMWATRTIPSSARRRDGGAAVTATVSILKQGRGPAPAGAALALLAEHLYGGGPLRSSSFASGRGGAPAALH
jgi:hypothetical protein